MGSALSTSQSPDCSLTSWFVPQLRDLGPVTHRLCASVLHLECCKNERSHCTETMFSTPLVPYKCTLSFGRLLHHAAAESDLHPEKQHSRETRSLFSNGAPGRITALGKRVFPFPVLVSLPLTSPGPRQGPCGKGRSAGELWPISSLMASIRWSDCCLEKCTAFFMYFPHQTPSVSFSFKGHS